MSPLLRKVGKKPWDDTFKDEMITVCSHCKKIMTVNNGWKEMTEIPNVDLTKYEKSHGVCPECSKIYYPEFMAQRESKNIG
jgi:uncharacterized protein with PIN domain